MKIPVSVNITDIDTIDEVLAYWTPAKYRVLLDALDFGGTSELKDAELREYVFMAIQDNEPEESAKAVLTAELSEELNEGQIDQLAHGLQEDRVVEEYPDMHLQQPLWHINQLLYKAYNGKFPSTKASSITFSLARKNGNAIDDIDKEMVVKALAHGLSDHSVIKRLFPNQLAGEEAFPNAEFLVWTLTTTSPTEFVAVTSDYLMNSEDFVLTEFEGDVVMVEDEQED